jgi:hypothetical protein
MRLAASAILADDPHDEMGADPAFEMLAMRFDAAMTWLRRDATFPVPVSPLTAARRSRRRRPTRCATRPGLPALERRD